MHFNNFRYSFFMGWDALAVGINMYMDNSFIDLARLGLRLATR